MQHEQQQEEETQEQGQQQAGSSSSTPVVKRMTFCPRWARVMVTRCSMYCLSFGFLPVLP